MRRYRVDDVREKITHLFQTSGLSAMQAIELAEQLLYAETRRITSHGLVRVKWVLEQVNRYPNHHVMPLMESESRALYDAEGVLGYLALQEVVSLQRESAQTPLKMIGVRNTYPTGALCYFAEKLAALGWIVLMSSTSPRRVGLHGDDLPLVGTNPWTFALPVPNAHGGYVAVDAYPNWIVECCTFVSRPSSFTFSAIIRLVVLEKLRR